ncbi:MAG: hypothetical protein BMS9Abin11_1553 [Gammaproteobacteria bacterium]|nr:MAG: hypothetical protein BMS9Abin11_1553 [Gammaproteobacteria bacterium]
MNKYIVSVFLFFIGMSSISVTNAEIRHGLWRFETSIEMTGMPMKMPPQSGTFCVKKGNYMPDQKRMKKGCKYKQEKDGNNISWHMSCANPKMEAKGNMKYSGRRMQGSSVATVYRRGKKVLMTTKINGQYLGSCK